MNFRSYFTEAQCLPDNCDCEFVGPGWIAQPSAFWSSLFYLFFAVLLYTQVKQKTTTLKLWTLSLILLGLSSHFAHASFIEFAMAMDFSGIILILSFFYIIRWLNKWITSPWRITFLLLSYQGGLWMTFYSLEKWFKVGLCLIVFFFCIIELVHTEGKNFIKARDIHWSLITLFLSFTFFLTDELKLICDPHSWLQGHSVWHMGTAVSLYLYGRWRFRTSASTAQENPAAPGP